MMDLSEETVDSATLKLLTRIAEALERAYPPTPPPKPPRPPQVNALSREPVLIFDTIPVEKRGAKPSTLAAPCAAANTGTTFQCRARPQPGKKFCDSHDDKSQRVGTIAWDDLTEADGDKRLRKKREDDARRARWHASRQQS